MQNICYVARMEHIIHPLAPVFDANSRVLILGTMPSPKSRTAGFYYAHPQNRFWRVLSAVYQEPLPESKEEKQRFVLRHGIALWDVVKECDIIGASDASIRNPVANDVAALLVKTQIRAIFTTGTTADRLYRVLLQKSTGMPAVRLPSPSPANCAVSLEALTDSYRIIWQITDTPKSLR